MQDARLGNPSVQQWSMSLPPHLCSLTAPDENTPPHPVNTPLKDAQLSRVPWAQHGIGSSPAQPSEAMHRLWPYDHASGVEAQP